MTEVEKYFWFRLKRAVRKNRKVEIKWSGVKKESSISGDCEDDFMNKWGQNREVKIIWSEGNDFY